MICQSTYHFPIYSNRNSLVTCHLSSKKQQFGHIPASQDEERTHELGAVVSLDYLDSNSVRVRCCHFLYPVPTFYTTLRNTYRTDQVHWTSTPKKQPPWQGLRIHTETTVYGQVSVPMEFAAKLGVYPSRVFSQHSSVLYCFWSFRCCRGILHGYFPAIVRLLLKRGQGKRH